MNRPLVPDTEPDLRLPGRNGTKADIVVYRRDDGRHVALKDYSARSPLVRNTLGRLLLRREAAAYRAAAGANGLPEMLGRHGAFGLALRWIDARPLAELSPGAVGKDVFARLDRIIAELHARGVALGDLHHRDVLVSADGSVHVVDLATALVLGDSPGPLRRALFIRWCEADRVAMARLRARFLGEDPDAAVAAVGTRAAARHRRGRWLKSLWDRLRRRR